MIEEKVQKSEEPRKKSNLLNALSMVVGVVMLLIVFLCNWFKSRLSLPGFFDELWFKFLLMIFGIVFLAAGIYLFNETKQLNKFLANDIFPYCFDYQYELAVYDNIGKCKNKKIDGKNIEKFERYSEWKNHILKWKDKFAEKCMENNKECEAEIGDFCRFLNKRKRDAMLNKDIATGVLIPVELGIIAVICGGDELFMEIKLIYAVILGCYVMYLYINEQYGNDKELHFVKDVIEILSQNSRK